MLFRVRCTIGLTDFSASLIIALLMRTFVEKKNYRLPLCRFVLDPRRRRFCVLCYTSSARTMHAFTRKELAEWLARIPSDWIKNKIHNVSLIVKCYGTDSKIKLLFYLRVPKVFNKIIKIRWKNDQSGGTLAICKHLMTKRRLAHLFNTSTG